MCHKFPTEFSGCVRFTVYTCRRPQIVFYEDRDLQGRYYACNSDCLELNTHFSRCNSVHVQSRAWVLHERPNYLGYQYVLIPELDGLQRQQKLMLNSWSFSFRPLLGSGFVSTSILTSLVRCWSALRMWTACPTAGTSGRFSLPSAVSPCPPLLGCLSSTFN